MPHPPIVIPEVGRGEEAKISATSGSCQEVGRRIRELAPETIVLLSPHATSYADYFHISPGSRAQGSLARFGAPGMRIQVEYDAALGRRIAELAAKEDFPAGFEGEREPELDHGALIPLYFINKEYTAYRLLRVGLSGLDGYSHHRLGQLIARAAAELDRRVIILASGDLSHRLKADGPYGFNPAGPDFDSQVTAAMAAGDFLAFLQFPLELAESAGECGLGSFRIMAGALDGLKLASELLSYEGPFGVGYGVAAFAVLGEDEGRRFGRQYLEQERQRLGDLQAGEDQHVRLARLSLETYVREGRRATPPEGLPPELTERRAGVFVSLKKHGQLRGCIGTVGYTTGSIAEEIMQNAVSAGCQDPRFAPVKAAELPELVYSVDVLGEPEPVDSPAELDPLRYGVIVSQGRRRGLLLPNLEGVDTVERQIEIARQKAGIGAAEPYHLQRFQVARHQ